MVSSSLSTTPHASARRLAPSGYTTHTGIFQCGGSPAGAGDPAGTARCCANVTFAGSFAVHASVASITGSPAWSRNGAITGAIDLPAAVSSDEIRSAAV